MSGTGPGALNRLAADAVARLRERGLTVSTAEATTGGLIGHLLTSVPGASAAFRGGVAPYSNHAKRQIGVPDAVLREHGAVSREAAEALAVAVREWAGADVGIAETGIAGPGGGVPERPVGLFWIAVADAGGARSVRYEFGGDRTENQRACAESALRLLLEYVKAR